MPRFMNHEELSPNQEAYCQLCASGYGKAEAYRTAYGVSDKAAWVYAAVDKLSKLPRIMRRIFELQSEAAKSLKVSREWMVGWLLKRMTYDPAELTRWLVIPCRRCHGDGHGYQWREHEFMDALREAEAFNTPLPDIGGGFGYDTRKAPVEGCPGCDGVGEGRSDFTDTRELSGAAQAAFEGVKQTATGIEIKMADKMAALSALAKITGMDVQELRISTMNIPVGKELAELAKDPNAIAATYKLMLTAGVSAVEETSEAGE